MLNTKEIKKTIGDNIKKIRISLNKEVKEVSQDLELSAAAYRNIERGLTDISISRILQISDYFNVYIAELLSIKNSLSLYFTPNNNSTGTQHNHQVGNQNGDGSNNTIDFLMKENEYLKDQNKILVKILESK